MTPELRVKRIYDEPSEDDGFRILVSVNAPTVTLLSSTKDLAGGHVGVLKQFIEAHLSDATGHDVPDD